LIATSAAAIAIAAATAADMERQCKVTAQQFFQLLLMLWHINIEIVILRYRI